LDQLEETLNTLLARLFPKSLGRRGRRVAIDLIELPYHGLYREYVQNPVTVCKMLKNNALQSLSLA
jgi:hypothetical protein